MESGTGKEHFLKVFELELFVILLANDGDVWGANIQEDCIRVDVGGYVRGGIVL